MTLLRNGQLFHEPTGTGTGTGGPGPKGDPGSSGSSVYLGFSVTGAGSWHATPTADDRYIRFARGTSRPGESVAAWGPGIQFVGLSTLATGDGRVVTQLDQDTIASIPDTGGHHTFSWTEEAGEPATDYDELIVHIDAGVREYLFSFALPSRLENSVDYHMLNSSPDIFADPDLSYRTSHPREVVVLVRRATSSVGAINNPTLTLFGLKYVATMGNPGPAGADGATGPAGADGATGPAGADGTDGADGADGTDGATGPAGPAGADGATGPAGADGATGPAGADGATGPAGADGATGPAGADGTDSTPLTPNPVGTDGDLLTRVAVGSTNYNLPHNFDDLQGMAADNQIPPGITRDTEIQDSVVGAGAASGVLTLSRRSSTNPVQVDLSDLVIQSDRGLAQVGSWFPSAAISDGEPNIDTGIPLPVSPTDDKLYFLGVRAGNFGTRLSPISGMTIKALPTELVGGDDQDTEIVSVDKGAGDGDRVHIYGSRLANGNLLLSSTDGWQVGDYLVLFDPDDSQASQSVARAVQIAIDDVAETGGTVDVTLSSDVVTDLVGTSPDFLTVDTTLNQVSILAGVYGYQIEGEARADANGGAAVLIYTLPDNTELAHTGQIAVPVSGEWTNFVLSGFFPGAADFTGKIRFEPLRRNVQIRNTVIKVILIGVLPSTGPPVNPSVSSFALDGDLAPAAGAVSETYQYSFDVAQSSHLSALRIVGFEGSSVSPSSVSVLATIASANYHGGSGSLMVSGFSLAADEVYTVRMEAYAEGQTPATDQPVSYHDVRITAHAPAAQTRFIRVPKRVGGSRPTAANLVANSAVIGMRGSVIGDWVVSGIPDDGEAWLVGWIVPASAAQPSHYHSGGLSIDNAFAAALDLTDNSVAYKAYLAIDDADADDSYNDTTITVS